MPPDDAPGEPIPATLSQLANDPLLTSPPLAESAPPILAPPGYEVLGELGRGGMGVVYKARQLALNRLVALKMILSGDHASADDRRRFLAEAEATAAVKHPGIVEVHEFGTHQGLPYFALELCAGGNLTGKIGRVPLPAREAAALILPLARAVQAAHDAGITHRDLKPANVLLTGAGEVKVTDFGLAKRDGGGLTRTGAVIGTPSYMAPEQALGKKEVGRPTDIYALGAILYECVTGRPPFLATTAVETLQAVVAEEPVAPRALNPNVPPDLETIALKCLNKAPERRYASAAALADDLRRWLDGVPIHARPAGAVERAVKWARRRPTAAALLGVCLGAGVALVVITLVALQQHEAAVSALAGERRAQREKALGEVVALRDAAADAVPRILADLEANRDEILPRLRVLYAEEKDRGKRMRLALALLPVEPEAVRAELVGWMLQAEDPAELLLARDALRPHGAALKDDLWKRAEAGTGDGPFRALVALAAYDPGSPRWDKAAGGAVSQMLSANSLYLGRWVEALRPVRARLTPCLGRVFRGDDRALAEYRKAAANVLADYLADQPDALAERLMEANLEQFATLFDVAQRRHRGRVITLFTAEARRVPGGATEAAREALAARQANAGLALLKLGRGEAAWPLLRHTPYPEARSRLVAVMGPGGVEARAVIARLEAETDVSARRALILALGEYTDKQLPAAARGPLVKTLLAWYRDDPDAGVHGAIDWVLRHGMEGPEKRKLDWGQRKELVRIDDEQAARSRRLMVAGAAGQLGQAARGWLAVAGALLGPAAGTSAEGWHVNGQGQTFAVIDGREPFLMGSPQGEAGRNDRENQHWQRIGRRYAVQTKPVTVAQWGRFQKAVAQLRLFKSKPWAPEEGCPVVAVSWYEAAAYCRWLSEQEGLPESEMAYPPVGVILDAQATGKPLRLPAGHLGRSGYRLPCEAEWERASRAGAATSRYYGSSLELLPRYAWLQVNSNNRTWPVGQKRPTDLGLFDLHGNAWQWCQDRYDAYAPGTRQRPVEVGEEVEDITDRSGRVLRGGAFNLLAPIVRSSYRNGFRPSDRDFSYGLRVCRTLPPRP